MGVQAVRETAPAFYVPPARSRGRDIVALLHPPYTVWHLTYVALGAGLASELDWWRFAGTVLAFFLGTGIAAHALDEWRDRPLRTGFSDRALLTLGVGGFAAAIGVAVVGAFVISPWVFAWAVPGVLLAAGYVLEWNHRLHSNLGFAVTWGAFPVLVGYWAQAETITPPALAMGAAATVLSLTQRALSTSARFARRSAVDASVSFDAPEGKQTWDRDRLLATWELPLKLLTATTVLLAISLLAARV